MHKQLRSIIGRMALLLMVWVAPSSSAEEGWLEPLRGWVDGAWQDWQGNNQETFSQVWQGALPRLEATLELSDQHDELPASAWFGADQASNQVAINELLDETLDILALAPAQQYRQQMREIEQSLQQTREQIARYRRERVAAPEQSLLQATVADLDANIRRAEARVFELEQQLTTLKNDFAQELQQLGLELSPGQLDFLLSTVIGDDLVNLGIVFDNVREITSQLEVLMAESQHDLDSARRYYGMYTVMLNALDRMHQQMLTAIQQRYLEQIEDILQRTENLARQTRELQRQSPLDANLAANLQAQSLTLETARMYRDYLLEQAAEITAARERLALDRAIAQNTYDTVKVSGELVSLMRSSQQLLEQLIQRQVPALRTFQSLEMQREFENLTLQLRNQEDS